VPIGRLLGQLNGQASKGDIGVLCQLSREPDKHLVVLNPLDTAKVLPVNRNELSRIEQPERMWKG
jgi:hypothetical protein